MTEYLISMFSKVERLDELLENDGELIAARIVDVEFHFDIDGEQVLLSGVPIELGLTSVKVIKTIAGKLKILKCVG